MKNRRVIVFDGVCNFCNGTVRFIWRRDPNALFQFTPMQSVLAKELVMEYGIDNVGLDTFVLIKSGKAYTMTDAAMEIAKDLSGGWWLFNILRIVPSPVRDYFYRLFARNRYKFFGRTNECEVPSQELRSRFIGIET